MRTIALFAAVVSSLLLAVPCSADMPHTSRDHRDELDQPYFIKGPHVVLGMHAGGLGVGKEESGFMAVHGGFGFGTRTMQFHGSFLVNHRLDSELGMTGVGFLLGWYTFLNPRQVNVLNPPGFNELEIEFHFWQDPYLYVRDIVSVEGKFSCGGGPELQLVRFNIDDRNQFSVQQWGFGPALQFEFKVNSGDRFVCRCYTRLTMFLGERSHPTLQKESFLQGRFVTGFRASF